jgi:phage shock protein PspC (stress-responsive transcriptional regulator)
MTEHLDTAPSAATATDPGAPTATDPSATAVAPLAGPRSTHFTLRRSRTDRVLAGVCGGLAAGLGADPALLRVLMVALTLITGGAAAIVYVAAWALAPLDPPSAA